MIIKNIYKNICGFFRCFAQVRLDYCGFNSCGGWGALRVYKDLWRQHVRGVGLAVWNHWLASIGVVLERTTPIAIGEDHLQAPLVLPH